MTEQETIEHILRNFRRIAVVGISPRPERDSHHVASYMRNAGYDIVPVNPRIARWEDLPCYPDLHAAPAPIEVVDIFRRSSEVAPIVDEAIAIGARAVWMQIGVVDDAAAVRARAKGMLVVMDRCLLREHGRL